MIQRFALYITLLTFIVGSSHYVKPVLVESVAAFVTAKPILTTVVPCITFATVYGVRRFLRDRRLDRLTTKVSSLSQTTKKGFRGVNLDLSLFRDIEKKHHQENLQQLKHVQGMLAIHSEKLQSFQEILDREIKRAANRHTDSNAQRADLKINIGMLAANQKELSKKMDTLLYQQSFEESLVRENQPFKKQFTFPVDFSFMNTFRREQH